MTKAAVTRAVGTLQLSCVPGGSSTDTASSLPWVAGEDVSEEVTWVT